MFIVYILRSKNFPDKIYKGFTTNIEQRLKDHNAGNSRHTNKARPWELIFYASFENKKIALQFEKYLKTASGIAFTRKRLIKTKKQLNNNKTAFINTLNKKKILK